ncbi:TPA: hypothetical protein SIA31_000010 [Aeromonas sobria]|nr:hypothetical protein [Aeromonas sobria]
MPAANSDYYKKYYQDHKESIDRRSNQRRAERAKRKMFTQFVEDMKKAQSEFTEIKSQQVVEHIAEQLNIAQASVKSAYAQCRAIGLFSEASTLPKMQADQHLWKLFLMFLRAMDAFHEKNTLDLIDQKLKAIDSKTKK